MSSLNIRSMTQRYTALRDMTFPLRRADRYYTHDLRFMALRPSRLRRTIALYEFAGIDHREHQLWLLLARARSWSGVAGVVVAQRARPPVSAEAPTQEVLELSETLADPPRV
jgi:hypothetical protein